ncbi:MAG: PAS domain S-box-containing protein [Mariniblastus sp.]
MPGAPNYPDEDARLEALQRICILDTESDPAFEGIVQLASEICQTSIALISFVDEDRQWFKAKVGLGPSETPRRDSFCAHAICEPDRPLIVTDATQDVRFASNPLVVGEPNIRFYAGVPIFSHAGRFPLGTLCVIHDSTRDISDQQLRSLEILARQVTKLIELREANLELREKSSELERIFEALPCGLILTDVKRRIKKVNPVFVKEFGYQESELLGKTTEFLYADPKAYQDRGKTHFNPRTNEHLDPHEVEYRRKDESAFSSETIGTSVHDSEGRHVGMLALVQNITERKIVEQKIAELSEIVQSSDDAIFRITPDGVIRTWNLGARKLFDFQASEVIGEHVEMLVSNEQSRRKLRDALVKINLNKLVDCIELKTARNNGIEIDAQLTISPIFRAENELDGASIVMRDITQQKLSEAANLDKVRRRDHFLAMLSHELRNPVTAITCSLAVLDSSKDKFNAKSALEIIGRHARQLSRLLDDLLDVSRITHDKIKLDLNPIDLVLLSKHVVESIESRLAIKRQSLTVLSPDVPLFVLADSSRILQAQVNLLVNASKYTPVDGNITLSFSHDGNLATIQVKDDGEGMTEDLLTDGFDVFVQAEQPLGRGQGGMGLGLPLVRMIARAHGGDVTAASDGLGKGSRFRLTLPMTSMRPLAVAQKEEDFSDFLGVKLLLVEDNKDARGMMKAYLGRLGFHVVAVQSGLEGLRSFVEDLPVVGIVDVGLPDLDGYEVAMAVRKLPNQPDLLIALTGYGQATDKEKAAKAGFDLHLTKPIDPRELVSIISKQLKKRGCISG